MVVWWQFPLQPNTLILWKNSFTCFAYALSEDCMKKFVANSVKYAQTGKFLKMYHESDDIYNVWWMRSFAKFITLKNIKKLIATMKSN